MGHPESLQRVIVRPRSTFRSRPVDDLIRILDITCLAVYAVGGIDLEPLSSAAVIHHFANLRRAEPLAGIAELFSAAARADRRIAYFQVGGLVFIVVRSHVGAILVEVIDE